MPIPLVGSHAYSAGWVACNAVNYAAFLITLNSCAFLTSI